MRKINFYKTDKDKCPVEEFLQSLNNKHTEKVFWVFDLVEETKNVPKEYFKKLVNTDDIWEIRVKNGNNAFRFLGFLDGAELIMLNHAFTKKTQKTPKQDIQLAEKRKQDYYARKGK